MTGALAIPLILAAVAVLGGLAGVAISFYRLGRRDGLEEKSWLDELPPVELGEQPLAPLDLSDPVDRLIYQARMEGTT